MEVKLKDQVQVKSFTFKKRVIEEAMELIGEKNNFVINDIEFVVMIAFLNNLVENNLILETLHDIETLEQKLNEEVEPLFTQLVVENETYLEVFEDIVGQMEDYMIRAYKNRQTVAGFFYDIINEIGDMSLEDVSNILEQVVQIMSNPKTTTISPSKQKPVKNDSQASKEAVIEDIQNLRMKALIEQYARQGKTEDTNA